MMLTHRRRTSNLSKPGLVILFAEDEGNEHYGKHVWTLETELSPIPEHVYAFAREYYDSDNIDDEVNPTNIVDTAGVWDDTPFVSALWQHLEHHGIEAPGYLTQDGAVVMDRDAVVMTYTVED